MPKAAPLTHTRVIDYFKTVPLETASLVLDLVTGEVKGRKQKSQDAKAAQQKGKKKAARAKTAPAPAAEEPQLEYEGAEA